MITLLPLLFFTHNISAQDIVYKINGKKASKEALQKIDVNEIVSMVKKVNPDTFDIEIYVTVKEKGNDLTAEKPVAAVQGKNVMVQEKENEIKEGDLAPVLRGINLTTGEPLATMPGKVVLINFWATWCVPCVMELRMPEYREMVQRVAGNPDGQFLAVAVDEEEQVRKFLNKVDACAYLRDHVFCDPKREQFHGYAPSGIPRTYLLDKEGRVVKFILGVCREEQVEAFCHCIDSLLKK